MPPAEAPAPPPGRAGCGCGCGCGCAPARSYRPPPELSYQRAATAAVWAASLSISSHLFLRAAFDCLVDAAAIVAATAASVHLAPPQPPPQPRCAASAADFIEEISESAAKSSALLASSSSALLASSSSLFTMASAACTCLQRSVQRRRWSGQSQSAYPSSPPTSMTLYVRGRCSRPLPTAVAATDPIDSTLNWNSPTLLTHPRSSRARPSAARSPSPASRAGQGSGAGGGAGRSEPTTVLKSASRAFWAVSTATAAVTAATASGAAANVVPHAKAARSPSMLGSAIIRILVFPALIKGRRQQKGHAKVEKRHDRVHRQRQHLREPWLPKHNTDAAHRHARPAGPDNLPCARERDRRHARTGRDAQSPLQEGPE